jgi:hypothetical protein
MQDQIGKCEVERQKIAHDIMNFIDRLATHATNTAARADNQLAPICLPDRPCDTCDEAKDQEYPPMFNEIRDRLVIIDGALNRINNTLDRAEV